MTLRSCPRQPDVLELLARGQWPQACPPELRSHFDACASCRELLVVTLAFRQSRAAATAQVHLPAPGVLLWRAQLRRRNAAVERVGKPILGAYIFALAVAVLVAAAALVSQARNGFRWLDWLAQSGSVAQRLEPFSPSSWFSSGWGLSALIPVFATVVLVSAVVVYLTAERQ